MKATAENISNPEADEETYYSYFTRQRQYLEIIYFQNIRNLKIDSFSRLSFYYFLEISEFLSSKIFNILDKKQSNQLSLEEFINGVILIFSKYFPENGKALTNIIFYLISDNSENFNYEKISEFFNNLISECLMKSKIYSFDFYSSLIKKIRDYILKIFSINSQNVKTIKFSKKDFLKVIEKNPSLINLITMLLNLLTPINEKLVSKLAENSVKISLNDDFEDEYEIDSDNDETKPKINSIPVSFMESQNVLKNNSFDRSYNERTIEKIELRKRINNESYTNENNNISSYNNSINSNYNDSYNNTKEENINRGNNSCGNANLNYLKNNLNYSSNVNNTTNNQILNTNNNGAFNKGSKSSQKDDSTDISDVSGNKLLNLHVNQKPAFENNKSPELTIQKIVNNTNNNMNNKGFNQIPKININLENNSFNLIQEANSSEINMNKDKTSLSFSESSSNVKNNNFQKMENIVINDKNPINKSSSNYNNNNQNLEINKCDSKNRPIKTPKEYNLGSERNSVIPIKNYKIIKGLEKEENLFTDIMIFYREIKNKSSNSTENNHDNGIQTNNSVNKKNFRILFSKNLQLEKSRYIINLEEFCPLIIKIIDFDLLLIQQNLKTNKNESIHFLNLKNIYLDKRISFENNEYYFNYNGVELKYYILGMNHFKQIYNILFESYNEMDNFLNILNKHIANLLSINLSNYRLIFKTINLVESKKKAVCVHEINDMSANKVMKLQTFKKESLKDDHFIFFKKVMDLCKMNKFLKANLFPVSNIYENVDFIIVEYVDNEFKINYDKKENNFTISLKKVDMSSFIKDEVIKFKKIIKALNNKKFVSSVYELIDMQGLVGIKK